MSLGSRLIFFLGLLFVSNLSSKPLCIYIEGVAGIGKTTLLSIIHKHFPEITVMYEPIEEFCNVHGNGNILDLYFKDQLRWAFAANIYVTATRLNAIHCCLDSMSDDSGIAIIDRSPYADLYVFSYATHSLGTLSTLELEINRQIFEMLCKNFPRPDGFIYLRGTSETALKRIDLRGRLEEETLSQEFAQMLHYFYEEWFMSRKNVPAELLEIPLVIIDAEQNFKDDPKVQQDCMDQIQQFINCLMHHKE